MRPLGAKDIQPIQSMGNLWGVDLLLQPNIGCIRKGKLEGFFPLFVLVFVKKQEPVDFRLANSFVDARTLLFCGQPAQLAIIDQAFAGCATTLPVVLVQNQILTAAEVCRPEERSERAFIKCNPTNEL